MSESIPLQTISVIVPTIGRPESLRRMLVSLCQQTVRVNEVIVADGSSTNDTTLVIGDKCWHNASLIVKRIAVHPPNAVRQRQAAINESSGVYLLLLDDDVVLEPNCVAEMVSLLRQDKPIVGVFADFNNQSWPRPTRAWRFYLRYVLRMPEGAWQGRVVGPLLRFGYNPIPKQTMPMDWLGTCNTMIRRSAYEQAGGFSSFFLHRCTMNEDVDLGLKMSRVGQILFCPTARMGHYHAPGGRVRPALVAEDDLYNRFMVLHCTVGKSKIRALGLVLVFGTVETVSAAYWSMRRLNIKLLLMPLYGRLRALLRIMPLLLRGNICQ